MDEEWRDIPGYEGYYRVSNMGSVMSFTSSKRLSPARGKNGYPHLCLCRSGGQKHYYVHELVMLAFVGNRPVGFDVNHKNGNRQDNRFDNLEYISRGDNHRHAYRELGKKPTCVKGEKSGMAKLSDAQVKEIRGIYQTGVYQEEIARMFGVGQSHISRIIRGESRR